MGKKQGELDEQIRVNNALMEKEMNLMIEIEEIRGLLNNHAQIKQLENIIMQLSGILLSNNVIKDSYSNNLEEYQFYRRLNALDPLCFQFQRTSYQTLAQAKI